MASRDKKDRGEQAGDRRKGLVAGLLRRRALLDNRWLAVHLHMGERDAVSRTIRHEKRGQTNEETDERGNHPRIQQDP